MRHGGDPEFFRSSFSKTEKFVPSHYLTSLWENEPLHLRNQEGKSNFPKQCPACVLGITRDKLKQKLNSLKGEGAAILIFMAEMSVCTFPFPFREMLFTKIPEGFFSVLVNGRLTEGTFYAK